MKFLFIVYKLLVEIRVMGEKFPQLEVFTYLVGLSDSGVWIFCWADPMVVRAR